MTDTAVDPAAIAADAVALAVLPGSIATGASQLRAVFQEVLELTPRAARN